MILRVAILIVVVISAQAQLAQRRNQLRGDTGTILLGRASSCIIKSRAVRFDDEVISGRQSFGQNGGLYIPPTTDDDEDDEDDEEEDIEQSDQPEGGEEYEEPQEQYDEDDEDAPPEAPQGPPLFNLAALLPALAAAAGLGGVGGGGGGGVGGGAGGAAGLQGLSQRPQSLPSQYFDPDDLDTAISATSAPQELYGGGQGQVQHYGGHGGGGHGGHGYGNYGGKGGKGGKKGNKKKRRGNINCIIITKDKKHKKPHKHKPLSIFGIPITSRRRRSMARALRALKVE